MLLLDYLSLHAWLAQSARILLFHIMQHYAKYDVSELETTHHLAVLLHTLEGSRHWTTGSVPIVVRCAILADEQSDQSHSFHWVSLLVFELALWAVSTAV